MALQLPTGEYIAIEEVNRSGVIIRFYKDAEQRARYKAGTMDKYEITSQQARTCEVLLSDNVDPGKNIQENMVTAGYTALKTTLEFSEAIDV